MTRVMRVVGGRATLVEPVRMVDEHLSEAADLEPWIVENIGVLDPALKVVTTQFNRWESEVGAATERLDILALAQSGELVVIELKRGHDKNIHLQAISYGALVAGFTRETLAHVHAEWVNRRSPDARLTEADALQALGDHVDEWSDETLQQIRLVLVAEHFPPLVLTTVQWLADRAPELRIECHQYTLFKDPTGLMIAFDRLYPVDDLSDRVLAPSVQASAAARQVATSQRQARSVTRIHQLRAIPEGASLTLEIAGHVRPEIVEQVNRWLDAEPLRRDFVWVDDPNKPIHWAYDPSVPSWTPTGLRNRIFVDAGVPTKPSFSAADCWCYQGKSLYQVANEASAGS